MTTDQMIRALGDVGASFAVTTAKVILPGDPRGAEPAYHVYPDASNPSQDSIIRIPSQRQFGDWIRTMKAAKRAVSPSSAQLLWDAYDNRWK